MNITFNIAAFRLQFPAFATNLTLYSDAALNQYFQNATMYVQDYAPSCYGGFPVDKQTYALYLMTSHLCAISALIMSGNTPGVLTGATIDKISVSLEPPPVKDQWQYWLQTTPYGQQLLALMTVNSVGGIFVGGRSEIAAFRKVGGLY